MQKRWKIKDPGNRHDVEHLMRALNIERSLANLLVQRGIKTYAAAESFFRPAIEKDLHDPYLMKDMGKAVARINNAMTRGEKILIYGDYDVDGTTAVSMVYSFLKERYDHLGYYIPDRYSQGYGVSIQGIDYAADNGYSLIIALDCGIKAVDKVKYAETKNIDFIICDHHTPGDKLPNAVAVLDPKRDDCEYPFKHLSGCGVGYKLLQALSKKNGIPEYELHSYLDLLCVSIASDIVPIVGENRVLCSHGLHQLNGNPCPGLKAIIKVSGIEHKSITVSDIVFKIGPRINAAGRMELGRKAVDLLTSPTMSVAESIVSDIDSYNDARKDLDRNITHEALDLIVQNPELKEKKTTVLYKPEWHKGVIGIVASRLTETFYKPTVILCESNGFATGSARSVEGYDLYAAIESCSDLLVNFGGHTYAAGLTMKKEKVPVFMKRFEDYVANNITNEQLVPVIDIDCELVFKDISDKFFRILKQFAPFGPDNMAPVFLSRNVTDFGTSRLVGKTGEHFKLDLMQHEDSSCVFQAIAFNQAKHYDLIKKRIPFDVCYTIYENEFRGKTTLQLMVKDIRFPEEY